MAQDQRNDEDAVICEPPDVEQWLNIGMVISCKVATPNSSEISYT